MDTEHLRLEEARPDASESDDSDFLFIDEAGEGNALDPQRLDAQPEPGARSRGPIADFLSLCISLGFNYLSWTQLTPMVLLWGFMIIMLVLASFLNFQDQSIALGIQISEMTSKVPGLNETLLGWYDAILGSGTKTEDGGLEWKDGQMTAGILKAWGYISLFMLVLGSGYRFIFKRQTAAEPTSLRRKLSICAIAALVVVAIMFSIDHFSNLTGNEDTSGMLFVGYGVLLWLVSAYGLTASHFLGWLADRLSAS